MHITWYCAANIFTMSVSFLFYSICLHLLFVAITACCALLSIFSLHVLKVLLLGFLSFNTEHKLKLKLQSTAHQQQFVLMYKIWLTRFLCTNARAHTHSLSYSQSHTLLLSVFYTPIFASADELSAVVCILYVNRFL